MARDIAIDIGANTVRIAEKGRGVVLSEAAVMALDEDGSVLRIGNEAQRLLSRSPGNITALYPFKEGLTKHREQAAVFLDTVIRRVVNRAFIKPDAIVCLHANAPGASNVCDLLSRAPIKHVYVVESPFAAAAGVGCDVFLPKSHLVVDIGEMHCDIGLISLGSVVTARSCKISGHAFDRAIYDFVKKNHGLKISQKTAEKIKLAVGTVYPGVDMPDITFTGRSIGDGKAAEAAIGGIDTVEALRRDADALAHEIAEFISEIPIEHMTDVRSGGVILCGGASNLMGLDLYLGEKLNLPVKVAPDSENTVVLGASKLLEYIDELPLNTFNISRPRDSKNLF